jgi:hypothetical protein
MDVTSPLSIGHQLFKFNKFGICMKCSVDYIRDCRKIPKDETVEKSLKRIFGQFCYLLEVNLPFRW